MADCITSKFEHLFVFIGFLFCPRHGFRHGNQGKNSFQEKFSQFENFDNNFYVIKSAFNLINSLLTIPNNR